MILCLCSPPLWCESSQSFCILFTWSFFPPLLIIPIIDPSALFLHFLNEGTTSIPGEGSSCAYLIDIAFPLSVCFLFQLSLGLLSCTFAKAFIDLSTPGDFPLFLRPWLVNSPLSLRECTTLCLHYRLQWILLFFKTLYCMISVEWKQLLLHALSAQG